MRDSGGARRRTIAVFGLPGDSRAGGSALVALRYGGATNPPHLGTDFNGFFRTTKIHVGDSVSWQAAASSHVLAGQAQPPLIIVNPGSPSPES
jgi:hypothetical protein